MVQIEQLAKNIEEELNGNIHAVAKEIKFKIHSSVGNYNKSITGVAGRKQNFINGVLRSTGGDYTPIKNINNLFSNLMLEFAVPQGQKETFELIMSTWFEDVIGSVYNMGDWSLLITPQPVVPGTAKNTNPIGATIPYLIVLNIQFIKDGLLANLVEWKINGEVVNAEYVGTSYDRTPDIKPITNRATTVADNQYETETITLVLPISYTNIIKTLLNDLSRHDIDKVYTIERNDGFSEPTSGKYTLTRGERNENSGKIVALTLTFCPTNDIE